MALALQRLPLFPLDVVLFPGMVLPLHIFESRYRQMVKDCVREGEPFGLVWAESEPLTVEPNRPLIGTKAVITDVTPLSDGRYNINTLGSERFAVQRLSFDQPYIVGHVEPYPSTDANGRLAYHRMRRLAPLLERYLALLSEAAEQTINLDPMPETPSEMAFAVSILYQGQNWRKQDLLAIQSIAELIQAETDLLQIENPLVAQQLEQKAEGRVTPLISGSLSVYGLN